MSTSTLSRSRAFAPEFIIPASAVQRTLTRGIEIADMRSLGFLSGIAGGAGGFNTTGELITATADGVDLNTLWNEFQAVNDEYNRARQAVVDFLTYSVTNPVEDVPVLGTQGEFEEASEFGVPRAYRPEFSTYNMGFGFKWYDLANRFTWQFLSEAPASQVRAIENQALEADSRLVFTKVMRQLFRNVTDSATIRGNAYNVYGFYNGTADSDPPDYKSFVHGPNHNHFLVSGGGTVDQFDLQEMQEHLIHHGYDKQNGYRTVLMANRTDTLKMRPFRSEQNGGPVGALYDFIPSTSAAPQLADANVIIIGGGQPAAQLDGMNVVGSYGDILIVEEDYIPAGYMVMFVTGGRDNLTNPIGFREHANAGLRGMRLVKGRQADYPLLDAYYVRGFGTGVRHRGAAVVMQIKASGSYVPPAAFL